MMTLEDMRKALASREPLEYHLTGKEQGASLLDGAGWYSCVVTHVYGNGNVEIAFTDPEHEDIGVTVLNKNIPIAFRRRNEEQPA